MKNQPLEPGLIPLFRLFLVMQLVLIYGNIFAHSGWALPAINPFLPLAVGSLGILLLFIYLSMRLFQSIFGRFYFPIAVFASATFSLVMHNVLLGTRYISSGGSSEESAWQIFLFLFIPLMLTGWQYGFKAAVAYCLYTIVLDVVLIHLETPAFSPFHESYVRLVIIRTFAFLFVAYILDGIMAQMRQQQRALQQANQKITHYALTLEQLTLSRERNRMARELHDTLAHTLSGLAVQLEGIKSLWGSDMARAYHMLEDSLTATRSGLTETRNAIQALRSTPLEDLGLALGLQELARAAAERGGFRFQFSQPAKPLDLPEHIEQCIYRVAQEALENIVNHARASEVQISLERKMAQFVLIISDNGVGFDIEEEVQVGHFGVSGMCERAEVVNGSLSVISTPGKGTTIKLEAPGND